MRAFVRYDREASCEFAGVLDNITKMNIFSVIWSAILSTIFVMSDQSGTSSGSGGGNSGSVSNSTSEQIYNVTSNPYTNRNISNALSFFVHADYGKGGYDGQQSSNRRAVKRKLHNKLQIWLKIWQMSMVWNAQY